MARDIRKLTSSHSCMCLLKAGWNFITSMKPTRIRMCHSLVMNYGLYKKMEIFVRIIV
jgi:histone deacetylase 1/2